LLSSYFQCATTQTNNDVCEHHMLFVLKVSCLQVLFPSHFYSVPKQYLQPLLQQKSSHTLRYSLLRHFHVCCSELRAIRLLTVTHQNGFAVLLQLAHQPYVSLIFTIFIYPFRYLSSNYLICLFAIVLIASSCLLSLLACLDAVLATRFCTASI